MKKCPHCKHALSFIQFLTRYGSDTLVKHPPGGHKREHACLNCHAKLWIHYNPLLFKHFLFQCAAVSTPVYIVFTWVLLKPFLLLTVTQSVAAVFIFLFMEIPFALTYAKYKSGVLQEEK